MRIVIVGASGNIGTALLRRLASDGSSHELAGICRRPPRGGVYDTVDWRALDLTDPAAPRVLTEAFAGADAVVHLAWPFQPMRNVAYMDRVAIGGSRAVFSAARAAGVGQLVHMSSLGAYSPGSKAHPADESWPTEGVPSSPYSRQKAAVERALDDLESALRSAGQDLAVARIRPALVLQGEAGAELLRYSLPPFVPARLVRHLPVLPFDRAFTIQCVHADDVAAALVAVLDQRATGPFNLAADPTLSRDDLAKVLGARGVHVPFALVRTAAALAYVARLQPVDPGWLDLAWAVPLLDASRARRELGWEPAVDAVQALTELVDGMARAAATSSPALRPRSAREQLVRRVRRGPITSRRIP